MAAPQGLAHFTGLQDIISADFALGHGISPSVCTITTVPRPVYSAEVGTLTLAFGGTSLRFPECAVDFGSLTIDNGQRWTLRILDRRWKWQFGEIDGRYNVRGRDGEIIKDTEKKPRELAKLLLDAMGEKGADTSRLPNEARPEVEWQGANPAQELAALCDSLGCRIVYGLNDRVSLWPAGVGKELPGGGTAMNASFGITAKVKPDSIQVVGGPVVVQSKLKLEAVGLDTDGSIKLIDKLSYKPAAGWASEDYSVFSGVTATYVEDGVKKYARALALQTVWKWYRIKEQAQGGVGPSAVIPGRYQTIDQLLPIFDVLNETAPDLDGIPRPRPCYVDGIYWPGMLPPKNTTAGTFVPVSFSVKGDAGVVEFSEAMVKVNAPSIANITYDPAELYLTTTYQVRPDANGSHQRWRYKIPIEGVTRKTGPRVLHHPDIILRPIVRYSAKKVTKVDSNKADIDAEMRHYCEAAAKEYQTPQTTDVQYAGLAVIDLDGAVVQWSFRCGGNAPCVTRVSRNAEHALEAIPYAEQRRREKQKRQEAMIAKWGIP